MYEQSGDYAAARTAFEMTLGIAESFGYTSIARQSQGRPLDSLESKGSELKQPNDFTLATFWDYYG